MSYKLVVIGTRHTRREEVPGVIRYHLDTGKTWEAEQHKSLAGGTRLVAKVAGVSELWTTGTFVDGEPFDDPESPDHERWRWGYRVSWDEPAAEGVPAGELLGGRGKRARGMTTISRDDWLAVRDRLYRD